MEIIINGKPERIYRERFSAYDFFDPHPWHLVWELFLSHHSLVIALDAEMPRPPGKISNPGIAAITGQSLWSSDRSYDQRGVCQVTLADGRTVKASWTHSPLSPQHQAEVNAERQIEAAARLLDTKAEMDAELKATKKKLAIAQDAAASTLKEALSKFMRFAPVGSKADTQARIAKAVQTYTTNPERHSLKAIAGEFGVSKKTVSLWFSRFTKETGYPVVQHVHHESVRSQTVTTAAQSDSGNPKKTSAR